MRWRQVAEFLADAGKLLPLEVRRGSVGKDLSGPSVLRRYAWGVPSAFAVALSLRPDSFLSHASAVFLRGLSHVLPEVVYANQEQTPKPVPAGRLTQESIDRAFANAPRTSKHVFILGEQRIVLLSGKATDNLQVGEASYSGETLATTTVERTLIDIAVRPVYAGGVGEVLRAYRSARDIVSVSLLAKTLDRLDYVYPYEQAIGFYLERAGYGERDLKKLEMRRFKFDFYLTNQIKERAYSPRWRLFYPKGL